MQGRSKPSSGKQFDARRGNALIRLSHITWPKGRGAMDDRGKRDSRDLTAGRHRPWIAGWFVHSADARTPPASPFVLNPSVASKGEKTMTTHHTGKGFSLEEAIRRAAVTASEGAGPDATISFTLTEVRGSHGGIASSHEVEADIVVRTPRAALLCGDAVIYQAYQREGMVTVLAYGQHRTAGFAVALELMPIDVFPRNSAWSTNRHPDQRRK